MKLLLANPRGFCAGVERAIDIVEEVLALFGPPIYVRHEVVHNRYVVDKLKQAGAIFIEDLATVPQGATLIFSAHGVSQAVREEARARGFRVFDATCPLVTKVHMQVARHAKAGHECILIGHKGHPEVEGTLGQYALCGDGGIYLVETAQEVDTLQVRSPENLMYVTQTTLSVDDTQQIIEALKQRFPAIAAPRKDDICYATQNRQNAVKVLAPQCDVMLVVGSQTSSNSNRLAEVAERLGCRAHLIDSADDMLPTWFEGAQIIGLTAGASAPDILVRQVIARLKIWGVQVIEEQVGEEETIHFALPKTLRGTSVKTDQ